jgi:hypothetical protein
MRDAVVFIACDTFQGAHMNMFRLVIAVLVLTRLCASLALSLLEGASGLLQAASFAIALIGIALVALLITGMRSVGRTRPAAGHGLASGHARPVAVP